MFYKLFRLNNKEITNKILFIDNYSIHLQDTN